MTEYESPRSTSASEPASLDAFMPPAYGVTAPVLHHDPNAATPATRPANLSAFLQRPADTQRTVAAPTLRAAALQRAAVREYAVERHALQREAGALAAALPPGAAQAALQRQRAAERSAPPAFFSVLPIQRQGRQPAPADWVGLYGYEVRALQRACDGQTGLPVRELAAVQRRATDGLRQAYLTSPLAPAQRARTFGEHLATLQRLPYGPEVARVILQRLPAPDALAVQRARDAAEEHLKLLDRQDAAVQRLTALREQLAGMAEQPSQADITRRIQAKQGGGTPLPGGVRRQLEQGLNADLSRVRVHTDTEAHKLSLSVGAVAFTTGSDIFFQQGRYDPASRAGLELLAHEVTHTVQQAQGRVRQGGIDPDAGLEQEARQLGAKLASEQPKTTHAKTFASDAWKPAALRPGPHAPGVYTPQAALQRSVQGASDAVYYGPLLPLFRAPDLTIQRGWLGDAWNATGGKVVGAVQDGAQVLANKGRELIARGLHVIPGYRELCMVFGKDLVTGTAMQQNPNAILDALAGLVPGPLKEMLRHLRETNAIPKAWAWFKGELGKLDMGALPGEILSAITSVSLDKARTAVTRRVTGMKNLVTGSARKIAEIALDAVGAGFGPAAQQVIAGLKKSGDVILQVLRNPAGFARNLIQAVTGGFKRFVTNFKTHAGNALGEWLTGNTGLTFPKSLDIQGVFMVVMSVLGLTYQNFRGRLVKQIGADKVQQAEQNVALLQNIKSKGLHAAEEMQGSKQGVSKEVKDGVITEVRNNVVQAAVMKLVSMFVPGGGFVQAMLSAFKTVQFLIQEAASIGRLVTGVTSSISSIATGNIAGAVTAVEGSLGQGLTLALKFLAKLFGVSGIGTKVRNIIKKVKGRIDGVVGKIMDRAAKLVTRLVSKVGKKTETAGSRGKDKQQTSSSVTEKQELVNTALKEAEHVLRRPDATKSSTEQELRKIKYRYHLSKIQLLKGKQDNSYYVFAKINPEGKTPDIILSKTTAEWEKEWRKKQSEVVSALQTIVPSIKIIDPSAEVAIRGSLASGVKMNPAKRSTSGEPYAFNPTDFDVDVFVVSESIYRMITQRDATADVSNRGQAPATRLREMKPVVKAAWTALSKITGNRDGDPKESWKFNIIVRTPKNAAFYRKRDEAHVTQLGLGKNRGTPLFVPEPQNQEKDVKTSPSVKK